MARRLRPAKPTASKPLARRSIPEGSGTPDTSVIVTVVLSLPLEDMYVPGPLKLGLVKNRSVPSTMLLVPAQQGPTKPTAEPMEHSEELPLIPKSVKGSPNKVPETKVVMLLAGFSKLGKSNVTSRLPIVADVGTYSASQRKRTGQARPHTGSSITRRPKIETTALSCAYHPPKCRI